MRALREYNAAKAAIQQLSTVPGMAAARRAITDLAQRVRRAEDLDAIDGAVASLDQAQLDADGIRLNAEATLETCADAATTAVQQQCGEDRQRCQQLQDEVAKGRQVIGALYADLQKVQAERDQLWEVVEHEGMHLRTFTLWELNGASVILEGTAGPEGATKVADVLAQSAKDAMGKLARA